VLPTGVKGLNLAAADVRVLAQGLSLFYTSGDKSVAGPIFRDLPARVWKTQRFSSMTAMLHRTGRGATRSGKENQVVAINRKLDHDSEDRRGLL
jgi:2-polyprenyl-6-methoxyphenol hydroxylase-like FAD-dependent oxidoreductase